MKFEEASERHEGIDEIAVVAVYFLLDGDEVVYVGKTRNLHLRLQGHIGDKKAGRESLHGKWTHFTFVRCSPTEVGYEEAKYIGKYRPKLNVRERDAWR